MTMKITLPDGKKVDVLYKDFTIKTDQPKEKGGNDTAPDPFSLFLSSIGACAGFFILSFCQQRKIETKNLEILLKTEKDTKSGMINKIFIDLIAPKSFPDKYKKAVINAASLCTVKRHLENPPDIEISFKE
jgi:ribosomal protein S12 methylthiotransferase accessory factor